MTLARLQTQRITIVRPEAHLPTKKSKQIFCKLFDLFVQIQELGKNRQRAKIQFVFHFRHTDSSLN
jgi:hypothetical protein